MNAIESISRYARDEGRNHIVFCSSDVAGLSFIDVGREVATAIKTHGKPLDAFSFILEILSKTQITAQIGKYLALKNVSILFEPELELDLRRIFDSLSQDQCLIIETNASIADDRMNLTPSDNRGLNLNGLSFITI